MIIVHHVVEDTAKAETLVLSIFVLDRNLQMNINSLFTKTYIHTVSVEYISRRYVQLHFLITWSYITFDILDMFFFLHIHAFCWNDG